MSLSRDNKQGRGPNGRFLPTTSAEEARIIELEAQVSQLQTSNQWNAAEVVRLAESLRDSQEAALALQQDLTASQESLRLADQAYDRAVEQFRVEQDAAVRHAREVIRLGEENGALRGELQHANLKLDNRKEDLQAATAEIAELSLENTRLEALVMPEESPLLPLWARIAFAGIGLFIVAYWSHRMGFDAAMTLQGGAR